MPDSFLGDTKCGPRDGRGDTGGQGCPLALSLCATTFLFPFLLSRFPLALGTGPVQVACPGCWHVGSRSLAQHGTAQHGMAHGVPGPVPTVATPFLPPHGGHGELGEDTGRRLQHGHAGAGTRTRDPPRGTPNRAPPRPGMGTGTPSTTLGRSPCARGFQELRHLRFPARPPARSPGTLCPVSPVPRRLQPRPHFCSSCNPARSLALVVGFSCIPCPISSISPMRTAPSLLSHRL